MGISKQAEGACLSLLNTYIVNLKAVHFITYTCGWIYIFCEFCGLFLCDILSAVVRQ